MGEFATAVQDRLCHALTERHPGEWETEFQVAGTRVDVAGRTGDSLVLVELEWRRADPADNAAKLFRHLDAGELAASVTVCQVFTEYYDLATGGVSSKRKNAEFVGQVAAETIERLSYAAVEFPLDPPKRGGEWPPDWEATTEAVAGEVCADTVGGTD